MSRWLIAALSLSACAPATVPPALVDYARDVSVALVKPNRQSYCSGVVTGPREVTTALHCLPESGTAWILSRHEWLGEGRLKFAAASYSYDDVVVMTVSGPTANTWARVAWRQADVDDDVRMVGQRPIPWTPKSGHVLGQARGLVLTSVPVLKGDSGSGLFNNDNEVSAILFGFVSGASIFTPLKTTGDR